MPRTGGALLWMVAWMVFVSPSFAALVAPTGYTNSFVALPAPADWASFNRTGAGTDTFVIDDDVNANLSATVATNQLLAGGDPPTANATSLWSTNGLYIATRPTGNRWTALVGKFLNGTGTNATEIALSYKFAVGGNATTEETGFHVYYSLSGFTNSWLPLAALTTTAGSGSNNYSTNITLSWTNGGNLFLAMVDDNAAQGTDPADEIDNFSLLVTAGVPPTFNVAVTTPATNGVYLATVALNTVSRVDSGTPPYTVEYFTNSGAGNLTFASAGSSTTAPFTVSLGTLAVGTYNIYAMATDSSAPAATTNSITNTFTIVPPLTVTISAPADGSSFDHNTPVTGTILAGGGTPSYTVELFLDNQSNQVFSAVQSGAPVSFNVGTLFVGDHALRATVRDATGWTSNSVVTTVHITGPLGVTVAPADGASFIYGQSVALTANPGGGTPPYAVAFHVNAQTLAPLTSAPFTTNVGLLAPGTYSIWAVATDSATPTAAVVSSATNLITIADNPLGVILTNPTNGQSGVAGQPVPLAASASVLAPVGIASVEFFFDGVSVGVDTNGPFSLSAPPHDIGAHTAYAVATDTLGRTSVSATSTINLVVDPLANNNFTNRFILTGSSITVTGLNVGATTEPGEPTSQGFTRWGATLWWAWTAPVSGTVQIDTVGSTFNTLLSIYTGTAVNALTRVALNDNAPGSATVSLLTFQAVAGTEYEIQVGGALPFQPNAQPATGAIQLNLQMPPAVAITSPTNNSVYSAGSNFLLTAAASTPNGSVTAVEFYNGTTKLAQLANAPYEILVTNAPAGTNAFTAVVHDSIGLVATSAVVRVFVANVGITITSPIDGSILLTTNPVAVSVFTNLPAGTITNMEFYVDSVKFADKATGPFTASWSNVVGGSHRITAIGRADNGLSYDSQPVVIAVVQNLMPSNSVWSYMDNGSDQGTNWYQVGFDDSTWGSGPAPLGYDVSGPLNRAVATTNSYGPDPNNKYITIYYRAHLTVSNLTAYTNLLVSIERDDGAVIYVNGVEFTRLNMPNGPIAYNTFAAGNAQDDGATTFQFNTSPSLLHEGDNVIAAELHQDTTNSSDIWFQMSIVGVPILIHDAPPSVSLDAPTNGQVFVGPPSIALHATAADEDGTVAKVTFRADGIAIGESTGPSYDSVWFNPPVGTHTLTAVATDDIGVSKESAPVLITIFDASGHPYTRITAPPDGTIVEGPTNMLVSAFATALDAVTNVQFLANGGVITNDTTAPYSARWDAPFGTNTLAAVVFGANGLTGTSAPVTVVITIPPTNLIAPTISTQFPPAFSFITNLTNLTVVFSERVQNVDAGDLLINGIPATSVVGTGSNYTFYFPQPPYGEVEVAWASGHGITDFGWPSVFLFNELDPSASWEYELIDKTPPAVAARTPGAGAVVTNVTQIVVTFTEPVTGVDAADLLINGAPAFSVTSTNSAIYTFNISQPPSGLVSVTWATNNGIFDIAGVPNAFVGTNAGWTFTLDARTVLVQSNGFWHFLKGLAEASDPTNAWRQQGFNDSSWSNAPAPFFYGDPYSNGVPAYTLLSDMQSNYTSIFLRREFVIPNAASITNLLLNAQSDDGFIAWVNGVEVLRYNMPTGELAFNATAVGPAPEPANRGAAYILYSLTNAVSLLVSGTNTIAIQAFNEALNSSSDFGFNAQLYTYLPDTAFTAPRLVSGVPASGDVYYLTNLAVTFSEPVTGVDASDLLVNGVPATAVATTNNVNFTFTFTQPAYGPVLITWAANHGIQDEDEIPKPFNGNASSSIFTYRLFNPSAPYAAAAVPAGGITVTGLTSIRVRFNKAVTGVDASDFLVNGTPASTMASNSTTVYTFGFPQPAYGTVTIRWVTNSGIHDVSVPPNLFDWTFPSNQWSYRLVDPVPTMTITSPTNNSYVLGPDATVTIQATATDNDGTISLVEFFADAGKIGETTASPYTLVWSNVALSSYILRAVATDNSGLRGTSPPVVLNVVTSLPVALVRGPYLQAAAADRMTVRWRTDAESDSVVFYGTDPGSLTNRAAQPTNTTEHIVPVTGLQPLTKYYYSIGSSTQTNAVGTDYWFVTAPVPGTHKQTRFWALGDSGTANANARAVRDAFYNFAATNNHPPDIWLMLGDNAYNRGLDTEYQSAVFEMYPATLRNLPLWPTIGNHETDQAYTIADFPYLHIFTLPQQGEAGGIPSGTPRYYSFDYANIHFVCLDSMSSGRTTTTPMADWLRADLGSTTQDWVIVFFHHPPYTKGSHNSDAEQDLTEVRQNIVPILESYGVDLVMSGHSHVYERSYLLNGHYGVSTTLTPAMKVDGGDGRTDGTGAYRKNEFGLGVIYSVSGSSGQIGGGTLNHPAHYISLNELGSLVVDVLSNRLDVSFLNSSGVFRDHYTLMKRAVAPVAPLTLAARAVSTNAVELLWNDSGTNELGYVVERSIDGTNFARVGSTGLSVTNTTDGGLDASTTYYYRVRAYNAVGESGVSGVASAFTGHVPPSFGAIADSIIDTLGTFIFTNVAEVFDGSPVLTWSLDPGAPVGARIGQDGIFRWLPRRSQAGSTNSITIRVTDASVPPMTSTRTFALVVRDFVELGIDSTALRIGQSTNVTLTLLSSTPLTNVSLALLMPTDRLSGWTVDGLLPGVAAASMTITGANRAVITLNALPGQALGGTQAVARLSFTAATGNPSGILPLQLAQGAAARAVAGLDPTMTLGLGQVVVVGAEPVLQTQPTVSGRSIRLYGVPGTSCTIERTATPLNPASWASWRTMNLSGLSTLIDASDSTNSPTVFYRARQ